MRCWDLDRREGYGIIALSQSRSPPTIHGFGLGIMSLMETDIWFEPLHARGRRRFQMTREAWQWPVLTYASGDLMQKARGTLAGMYVLMRKRFS